MLGTDKERIRGDIKMSILEKIVNGEDLTPEEEEKTVDITLEEWKKTYPPIKLKGGPISAKEFFSGRKLK